MQFIIMGAFCGPLLSNSQTGYIAVWNVDWY